MPGNLLPLSEALNRYSDYMGWLRMRNRMSEQRCWRQPSRNHYLKAYSMLKERTLSHCAMTLADVHTQAKRRRGQVIAKWWYWTAPTRSKFDGEENQG
jgi:hypothetical protein